MNRVRLPLLIILAYTFILVGCGQKGPLYLPEKQTPPKIEVESTTPKAVEDEQKTNKDKAVEQTTEKDPSQAVSHEVKQ